MKRTRHWLAIFMVTAVSALVLKVGAQRAFLKDFWLDEGLEIMVTCAQPVTEMFTRGAEAQCSPNPLYYPLQKTVVNLLPRFDESILVKYRGISLVAGTLTVLVLSFWALGHAGLGLGLLASVALLNQGTFHTYLTESRPYLFWVFLFTLWMIWLLRLARKGVSQLTGLDLLGTTLLALALTFTTGPGMLQAGAGIASLLACWWIRGEATRANRRRFGTLFALAAACGLIGFYYGLRSCTFVDDGPWDLLKTRDIKLLTNVLGMLLTQNGFINKIEVSLVLIGLFAAPVLIWKARRDPSQTLSPRTSQLAIVLGGQLLITLLIGTAVVIKHYHFLPRMFIHLTVCRAFAVILGGWVLADWIPRRFPKLSRLGSQALVPYALIAFAVSVVPILRESRELTEAARTQTATREQECEPFSQPLAVYTEEQELYSYLNSLVRLDRLVKKCGWKPGSEKPEWVLLKKHSGENDPWFERSFDQPSSPATKPLTQCGRAVTLTPAFQSENLK